MQSLSPRYSRGVFSMKAVSFCFLISHIFVPSQGQNMTTDAPTITIGGNNTPAPTVYECYDYKDWANYSYVHLDCELFTMIPLWGFDLDEPGCPEYGHLTDSHGMTAKDACCYCGGGYRNGDFVPSYSPTATTRPTFNECIDAPFFNPAGVTCALAKESPNDFCTYGSPLKHACCICGGGYSIGDLPSDEEINSCLDVPGWISNDDGARCTVYKYYEPRHKFGYKGCGTYSIKGSYGLEVGDACCFCGGGSLSPKFNQIENFFPSSAPTFNSGNIDGECRNVDPLWTDSNGESCEFYHRTGICKLYPQPGNRKGGYSASSACCVCGGGLDPSTVIAEGVDPSTEYYTHPGNESSGYYKTCINDPTWKNIDRSCDFFNKYTPSSSTKCSDAARLVSDRFEVPFTEGCCACEGGYNGTLIKRSLRVGLVNDASNKFTYFQAGTNIFDGSIVSFSKLLSKAGGFSIFAAYNKTFTNSDRNYTASVNSCLQALDAAVVDMCLGSFWKNSNGLYEFSDSLYVDKFFLVVRQVTPSFWESLKLTTKPFTQGLWAAVILLIILIALLTSVVQSGAWCFTGTNQNCLTHLFSSIYFGIYSFVTRDLKNTSSKPSLPEKILKVAFVIFSLIVITAYGSTLTGMIVRGFDEREFTSINDIVIRNKQVCVQSNIYPQFVEKFPSTVNNTVSCNLSEDKFLLGLVDDEAASPKKHDIYCKCDAVISSDLAFRRVLWDNNGLCSKLLLADDSELLTVGVGIPISFHIYVEDWGKDLMNLVNQYVKYGQYMAEHLNYQPFALDGEICNVESRAKFSMKEMSSILLLSVLLSVCATCLFVVDHANRLRLRRWVSNNVQILSSTKLTTKESVELFREEVKHSKVSHLLRKLKGKEINLEQFKEARNKLPDRKLLEELVVSAHYPDYVGDMNIIALLPIDSLLCLLEKSPLYDVVDEESTFNLLDSQNNIKDALVGRIMEDDKLRQEARALAMEMKNKESSSPLTKRMTDALLPPQASNRNSTSIVAGEDVAADGNFDSV